MVVITSDLNGYSFYCQSSRGGAHLTIVKVPCTLGIVVGAVAYGFMQVLLENDGFKIIDPPHRQGIAEPAASEAPPV